jgi:hypothetical protein
LLITLRLQLAEHRRGRLRPPPPQEVNLPTPYRPFLQAFDLPHSTAQKLE